MISPHCGGENQRPARRSSGRDRESEGQGVRKLVSKCASNLKMAAKSIDLGGCTLPKQRQAAVHKKTSHQVQPLTICRVTSSRVELQAAPMRHAESTFLFQDFLCSRRRPPIFLCSARRAPFQGGGRGGTMKKHLRTQYDVWREWNQASH